MQNGIIEEMYNYHEWRAKQIQKTLISGDALEDSQLRAELYFHQKAAKVLLEMTLTQPPVSGKNK